MQRSKQRRGKVKISVHCLYIVAPHEASTPPNLPPLCFFLYCSPSVRLYQNKSQTKILLEQRQTLNAAGLGNDLSIKSIKTIKEKKNYKAQHLWAIWRLCDSASVRAIFHCY